MLNQICRRFASTAKTYGNLKDSDRIFTNVYKDTDPYIKGALRRVQFLLKKGDWYRTKDIIANGPDWIIN